MQFPQPKEDKATTISNWLSAKRQYNETSTTENKASLDFASEQMVLANVGLIGFVLKGFQISTFDDDMFSVGLLGLAKCLNSYDETKGTTFSTYAIAVIRNEILQVLRRQKKEVVAIASLDAPIQLSSESEVELNETVADTTDFEQIVVDSVHSKEVLKSLSPREQRIFFLFFQKGYSQKRIAKELDISQSYASRIIKSIRAKFEEK